MIKEDSGEYPCFGCDEVFDIDELTEEDHRPYCKPCLEDRTPCHNCEKRFDFDDMHGLPWGAYCEDCYADIYG